MKPDSQNRQPAQTELLLLPDGRVLAHNLTRTMAELLSRLDPADAGMRARARGKRRGNVRSTKPS